MKADELTLEGKIIAWSKQRPEWQRYLLVKIADGETFTENDYDKLVDDILDKKIPRTDNLRQVPLVDTGGPTVKLVSIERSQNTNALETTAPLTFDPNGITIVYGDNGAGKSGYARLLKCITRSRHQEDILSDVFRDESGIKPSALFKIQIDDFEKSVDWPEHNRVETRQILFYDAACCDEYISTESDFPYRPPAFLIMDRLVEACNAVRVRIDSKLDSMQPSERLPEVDSDIVHTEIGKFLDSLNKDSSVATLDSLVASLDEITETPEDLRSQEARLLTADASSERQLMIRNAERLDSLSDHYRELQRVLGEEVLAAIQRQKEDIKSLASATRKLARSRESEPLSGVGTSSWKELWESAKRFSEEEAYPKEVFPPVGTQHRCLLCQQEFDEDTRQRLRRLDELFNDDAQIELSEANRQYNIQIEQITNLDILPEAVMIQLADLKQVYPELVVTSRAVLDRFANRRNSMTKMLDDFTNSVSVTDAVNSDELVSRFNNEATELRKTASELSDPSVVQERLRMVTCRRKEVELLEAAKSSRRAIVDEIDRLKTRAELQSVKDSAATGPISRKISELSEEDITGFIRDSFTRETDRLQLERVTVAKTRASRGVLLHKPKLVRPSQNAPLSRVFSEGEKSSLGLAAFFTEARVDSSESTMILDDPVSSLDHKHRELVACRLVDFAMNRQVVIFTHDASFVADLKLVANREGVKITDRSVERGLDGERRPGKCVTKHPWHIKDVSERLGLLENDLTRIKDEMSNWDQEEYGKNVSQWAGWLSETWERIFRQSVVGPILADGGLEVRPRMVKILAKFSEVDEREFQASYSRISRWTNRHDKSDQVNYTPPEVDTLRAEFDQVKAWFDRVKGYKD